MQVTLGEREYIRYFGSNSPLQVYREYWRFDGGRKSLWSYVLAKAAAGLGMLRSTPAEREDEADTLQAMAVQLRLDAAGEAVMLAQENPRVEYGVADACIVKYDEVVDAYILRDALGMECTYFSELVVDIQEVARWLAMTWQEYEE